MPDDSRNILEYASKRSAGPVDYSCITFVLSYLMSAVFIGSQLFGAFLTWKLDSLWVGELVPVLGLWIITASTIGFVGLTLRQDLRPRQQLLGVILGILCWLPTFLIVYAWVWLTGARTYFRWSGL